MTRSDYDFDELVEEYGAEYVQEYYPDDMLYPMDEISEFVTDVWEALRSSFFGYDWCPGADEDREKRWQFNPNKEYFAFNGYGNLVSIEGHYYVDWLKRAISEDEFVDWCVEQGYIDEDEDEDIEGCKGIGAVLWEYVLMECQNKGIDLSKSYFEQPSWVISELSAMRKKFGYRQSASSKAMGRSENQSFYYAICRQYDKA